MFVTWEINALDEYKLKISSFSAHLSVKFKNISVGYWILSLSFVLRSIELQRFIFCGNHVTIDSCRVSWFVLLLLISMIYDFESTATRTTSILQLMISSQKLTIINAQYSYHLMLKEVKTGWIFLTSNNQNRLPAVFNNYTEQKLFWLWLITLYLIQPKLLWIS